MARQDHIDYGDLGMTLRQQSEVKAVLAGWEEQRKRLELAQLRNAANGLRYRRTIQDGDGNGGEVQMMIPPTLYHQLGSYYGYECWSDDNFCRRVCAAYPECVVETRSATLTIVKPDFAPPLEPKPKKFSKTFPNPPENKTN